MRLKKDRALFGIEARGNQLNHFFHSGLAEFFRILLHGESVQVNHGKKAVVLILKLNPLLYRAQIVPQMQLSRGLDAR
jgi:hypothetical protein